VASKPLARQDEEVVEIVAKAEAELGSEGRILLRESGTEPVLRVMVEAKSDEICKKYVESVVEVLNRRGHVVAD
jgi:phosphoglucosamine mutase